MYNIPMIPLFIFLACYHLQNASLSTTRFNANALDWNVLMGAICFALQYLDGFQTVVLFLSLSLFFQCLKLILYLLICFRFYFSSLSLSLVGIFRILFADDRNTRTIQSHTNRFVFHLSARQTTRIMALRNLYGFTCRVSLGNKCYLKRNASLQRRNIVQSSENTFTCGWTEDIFLDYMHIVFWSLVNLIRFYGRIFNIIDRFSQFRWIICAVIWI